MSGELTRRRLLIGLGAAVLAAGGVSAELLVPRDERERILRRLGLARSPDHQVPKSGSPEVRGQLTSRFMPQPVRWTISTPKSGAPAGVVYCFHGKGADHRMGFDRIPLPDVAAAVGAPLAIAGVDGGTDNYWHRRADGSDAMAMFLTEFMPMVQSHVGRLPQAALGWSMGGYGALLAAERATTGFRAVAAASPALWSRASATAPGAFDSPADFRTNDVFAGVSALRPLTVRIDCGTGDPFYAACRRLVTTMDFAHIANFGPGFHEDSYWRSVAPAQLRTIASRMTPSRPA